MPTTTAVLSIPTADGSADAFAAFPADGRRHPGVLLYPDAFGLRPELQDKARHLAELGHYVLVPNLYYRTGPAPVADLPAHISEEIRPAVIARVLPLLEELTAERALRDAEAFLEFLAGRPEAAGDGPVAVIGYCIGAAFALRAAAAHPDRVAALAGFHPGFLVTGGPDSPHRLIPQLTARVHLALSEGGDMSPKALAELTEALDAAGVDHTTEVYPGTVHGFTMADTGAFDAAALQRHWDRLRALLGRTLATG
ncbi:dienelactone hydrolase family protein [Kitasatospora sp. NPDC058965]|uniref:dienelactone hydrolase family protein n=1 Tax=Kitasatospora sp. NPDC058965 TaxID=3346682 RepID=UPI00369621C1